jgi:phage repressor protein C with HTH and peptisase S24 domain
MLGIATHDLHYCNAPPVSILANGFRMSGLESDTETIKALVQWAKLPPSKVAITAGVAVTTVTRPFNGTAETRVSSPTWEKLKEAFPKFPGWNVPEADLPDTPLDIDYEPVDVLPTFAGMGGGGTGEGEVERALIPSYLIRNVLRGKPSDFVLIRVRGDSMEPVFRQDDELLVDKRDKSPTQAGPFALWDADWGEYLVKNVERLPGGRVRIFSSNDKYTPVESANEETNILGRPVWFGRRL